MPDTIRRITLAMAAAAAVLHVWGPDAAADGERAVTDHIVVGLAPATSFSVLVEDDEIPASPVTSSGVGIVEFSVDDSGLPPGPHLVRVHGVGQLIITGVEVTDVSATAATVRWSTDAPASSLVEYGETPAYGSWSPLDPALVTEHAVELTGLSPGTTYHCRAISEDAEGRTATSSDQEFTTPAEPLEITGVSVEEVGDTWAVVTWLTNRPADSRVEYGTTPAYGELTAADPALVTEHAVLLNDLTADGTVL